MATQLTERTTRQPTWLAATLTNEPTGPTTDITTELSPEQASFIGLVDSLLHQPWSTDSAEITLVEIAPMHAHLTMAQRHLLSEAQIDLPDSEATFIDALNHRCGEGRELSNGHCRIHRWLIDGHELRLLAQTDGFVSLTVV